jgi:hypothetical protein
MAEDMNDRKKLPKQSTEEREINRLRQSLMTIGTWARCFDPLHESHEEALQHIIKETERALGVKK